MKRRPGPTRHFAYDPAAVLEYLAWHTDEVRSGHPVRTRTLLNGHPLQENDRRTIRRWRTAEGLTRRAVDGMLQRYGLDSDTFVNVWARRHDIEPIKRGNY